jgi:hypothetical protein
MKITTLTALALMFGTTCAFAADTVPTGNPSSSGRPSAILSDNQCNQVWQQALNSGSENQNGDATGSLTKDNASKYIANFAMVDKNNDGKISQSEFQTGCKNGWVQTAQSGGGTQSQSSSNKMNKSGG